MALDIFQDANALYRFCAENPQGLTSDELAAAGWTDQTQLLTMANQLLANGRLTINQLGQGKLLFKAGDHRLVGLDPAHMAVFQLVEKAGDKGTNNRLLKDASRLQQHTITKITKELMQRRIIKEVKSIQNKNRKVFMLYDVEPALEVSGGSWYHDGEFAASWVEQLRQRCQQYLEANNGKAVTLQDVHSHVSMSPGVSVPSEQDIEHIMRTLELDEFVYAVQASGQMIYTVRKSGTSGHSFDIFAGRLPSHLLETQVDQPGLVVPCLSCHLQNECQIGARVCPEKCNYLTEWLKGTKSDMAGRSLGAGDVRMNDW